MREDSDVTVDIDQIVGCCVLASKGRCYCRRHSDESDVVYFADLKSLHVIVESYGETRSEINAGLQYERGARRDSSSVIALNAAPYVLGNTGY